MGRDRLPDEFTLIARHFAPLARAFPGAAGLADDAAVVSPAPGEELVVTSDALVAGVHFLADDPPALVARKALRVNLSDLAAKGAEPLCYLLDLALARDLSEGWVAAFAAGLGADQAAFGVALAGGDTTATPGPTTIAVTALGTLPAGSTIRRSGAREGDLVFVSGTIGDAALGLAALRGELGEVAPGDAATLVERYRLPCPRSRLGPRLRGLATAAIDISDGLVADLGHLAAASGAGAVIEAARVPLSAAARALLRERPELLERVLTGGDDYELLFTAPPGRCAEIELLARELSVPIAVIGEIVAGGGVSVLDAKRRPMRFARTGWRHF